MDTLASTTTRLHDYGVIQVPSYSGRFCKHVPLGEEQWSLHRANFMLN